MGAVGPMNGVKPTAAEIVRLEPTGSLRSSCRKERKLAESSDDIMLQPIPCLLGYSQL